MIGQVFRFVLPETEPGLLELLAGLDLPIASDRADPNVEDIGVLPSIASQGYSGPAMVVSTSRIGALISIEVILKEKIRRAVNNFLREPSAIGASESLKERSVEGREPLPRGGNPGDLLWHTGDGWRLLPANPGSVLVSTPKGAPVWLDSASFVERMSGDVVPTADGSRASRVDSPAVSEVFRRSPVVWFSLPSAAGGEWDTGSERLRPALLMPGKGTSSERRMVVFLFESDRDWIRTMEPAGFPIAYRTALEGDTPGTWRKL